MTYIFILACNANISVTSETIVADEPKETNDNVDDTDFVQLSLSADNYRQAFVNIQQGVVTPDDCAVLVSLMRSPDTFKLADGLALIMKLSVTSTENKNVLLDNGIASELKRIIRCQKDLPANICSLAINIVSNLLLSDVGQHLFSDLVSELTDASLSSEDMLALSSLQCLTNLSVTLHSPTNFIKVLQCLLNALDTYEKRRLQICKVLVNLSSSTVLAPFLLAAKSPDCTLELLVGDDEIARRWLKFMTNITQIVLTEGVTDATLPTIYKAASPETMYSLLYGVPGHRLLTDKLLANKSADEELTMLTSLLYKNLKLKLIVPVASASASSLS